MYDEVETEKIGTERAKRFKGENRKDWFREKFIGVFMLRLKKKQRRLVKRERERERGREKDNEITVT